MKKRRYLYRLAMSVLLILILPMVIFIVCFGKYSYEKVEATNEEYCEALMSYYMVQLDRLMIDLKQHAADVCAKSKIKASVFYEKTAQDEYWYYRAISEIKENFNNLPYADFGIYYYKDERIITSLGKLSIDQYFNKFEIENQEDKEYLLNFFDEDRFEEYKICVGGTEKQAAGKNRLLVGFYYCLGKQRDKVLLFYEYTESDITDFFESAYIENGIEYSLWDKNSGFSFFFGNYNNENHKHIIKEFLTYEETIEAENRFLVKESNVHPIVLIGYMNENTPRNITLDFLKYVLSTVLIVLLFAIFGYLLVLYIAYKPIFCLTTKVQYTEGGEFEAIGNALDERAAKIEEQEMLLLDLLVNNLLYRTPIPMSKLKQLGVIEPVSCYTVFLLNGYVLSDVERKKMIAETEYKFQCRMFVTDLEGEKRSVFVLFLKDNTVEAIKEWLIERCGEIGASEDAFFGGKTVLDIKDIWSCLKYCEEELKGSACNCDADANMTRNNPGREKKRLKLREDILAYIEEHYRDVDLTQAQMADYFSISTYTLSRIFRNDVGIGFVTYVNAKRVEYAKEILLTTEDSVHDVALKSGFDNDNNFYKVFKANVGMSPTVFRES